MQQYGATSGPPGIYFDPEDKYAPYGLKLPYKRRINGVAILMSAVIPCLIFFLVITVLAYKVHHTAAPFAYFVVLLCLLWVIYFGLQSNSGYREKMNTSDHEPSWYRFVFITALLAWILALIEGSYIYSNYTEAYYTTSTMTVYGDPSAVGSSVGDAAEGSSDGSSSGSASSGSSSDGSGSGGGSGHGWSLGGSLGLGGHHSGSSSSGSAPRNGYADDGTIDPLTASGVQFMDAGAVYFAEGSNIDTSKYVFYSNAPTYCVAPITYKNINMYKYDLWAVGVDCCNEVTPSGVVTGFQCGEYNNPEAHAGLRVMSDSVQPYYRLAVLQAQAKFNISTTNPLFFTWMEDPIHGGGSSGSSSGTDAGIDHSEYADGSSGSSGSSSSSGGSSGTGSGSDSGSFGELDLSGGSGIGATGSGTWTNRHDGSWSGGIFNLWPFFSFPSDFGFGSGGGIKVTYDQGVRLYSIGLLGFCLLQCTLVACCAYAFSKIV